ncbi:MAG: OmpH family outer membrane protein [Alphaproteobacteria bacterium]|nr:OmpH family outer membrane protein [Alphaproteobacteria bacterium]
MKKFILKTSLILSFVLCAFLAQSQQRYAVINTKYILEKIPAYQDADKKIQQLGETWQREIDTLQTVLDRLYINYEAEKYVLTEDQKKVREDEIFNHEKQVRALQKQRFGFEGDLFKERQKLIKPIQDKIYNAIQKIAAEKYYDFVLDKSEGITVIFADPKLDKSDDVLRELGIKN